MISKKVQAYIEDHSFCSEYLFKDWEAFLDILYEERSLEDIKAYIQEMRQHGAILGDKYICFDLVPSFYLAE